MGSPLGAVLFALAILAAGGGYVLGSASGTDVDQACTRGEADATAVDVAADRDRGYQAGLAEGRQARFPADYRSARDTAYRAPLGGAKSARRGGPRAGDCGTVNVAGRATMILTLRGVSCGEARSVAARSGATGGPAGGGWQCGLARSGDTYEGKQVGFSCGKGATGDLRQAPQAFLALL